MTDWPQADAKLVLSLAARPGRFGFTVHNAGYRALGLNYFYKPMQCSDLQAAMDGIKALGIHGASLTMPHKINILPMLDELDPVAHAIGAVNTVLNNARNLKGYNTDATGALALLEKTEFLTLPWIILGAGGMARAFAYVAKKLKIKNCTIVSRKPEQAQDIAVSFHHRTANWDELSEFLPDALLLNATPIGMAPDDQEMPIAEQDIAKLRGVFDAIASPPVTQLCKRARDNNIPVITGFDLAIEQAVAQFEIYTGRPAPRAEMLAAAKTLLPS